MGGAIGEILTPAVGVALSPIPIIAVILMLFSAKAKTNGPAFVGGWIAGILIIEALVLIFADPANISGENGSPSKTASVIQLGLGILLLLLAVKQWRSRPKGNEEPKMPKWMATIDKTTPLVALGLGAFLSGVNPKNLIFNLSAGTSIVSSDASTGGQIATVIIYALLASLSVGVPVIWYLASPESAGKALEKFRVWLVHNNAIVMAVLFLVLGINIVGKGISGLSS
jgi:threonine/homoserine/homoserine lactone efflux protein